MPVTLDHLCNLGSLKSSDHLLPHLCFQNVLCLLTLIPNSHWLPLTKNFLWDLRNSVFCGYNLLIFAFSSWRFLPFPCWNWELGLFPKAQLPWNPCQVGATPFPIPPQFPRLFSGYCSSILEKNIPLMFMLLAHYGRLKFSLVFGYFLCSLIYLTWKITFQKKSLDIFLVLRESALSFILAK